MCIQLENLQIPSVIMVCQGTHADHMIVLMENGDIYIYIHMEMDIIVN